MTEMIVKDSVEIAATAEHVWRVLTDPELTPKYMFGCRTVSDWKVGSQLSWEGVFDGKELVAVTGKIVELVPSRFLHYTAFDPNSGLTDTPSNYLDITYQLTPTPKGVRLDVSQGDYAKVEKGQERYEHSVKEGGWGSLLQQIRSLAESR